MLRGSLTALITPFANGAVDEKAFSALVDWQIAEGTHGLVPMGTTGENPTVTHEEHRRVVEICVKTTNKRVPVLALPMHDIGFYRTNYGHQPRYVIDAQGHQPRQVQALDVVDVQVTDLAVGRRRVVHRGDDVTFDVRTCRERMRQRVSHRLHPVFGTRLFLDGVVAHQGDPQLPLGIGLHHSRLQPS